jgi:ubiquitin-conjugating enzyme (huntingtin interacting protein 2)
LQVKSSKIKIELRENSDFTKLKGTIIGPPETPFDGGTYLLDIVIPETYPFNPPKVKFLTRIWHPNISSVTGAICLDILKDQWAAAMTLRTVLLSIQALLSAAEPDDPQDAVVAKQYKENNHMYRRTARHWAQVYAGATIKEDLSDLEDRVKQLVAMGFGVDEARASLSSHNWDVQRAVDYLFS